MDFTIKTYSKLLNTLLAQGYSFATFADYYSNAIKHPNHEATVIHPKIIILRHDVEARYENALKMAEIQHALGIKGSYYFRLFPRKKNEGIIRSIAALGHEIGYHYDDLSHCKGDHKAAINRFRKNLDWLRTLAPVQTITMEGAPLSRHDNRDLWNHYEYKNFGIMAEPYFDVDYSKVLYLTDTGRRWDGVKMSVRDKVGRQEKWIAQGLVFRSTMDIIKSAEKQRLPDHMMMTFHPQRWNDQPLPWLKELVLQNIKNQVKKLIVS